MCPHVGFSDEYQDLYPINAIRNLSLMPVDDEHLIITMDIDNMASALLSTKCSDPKTAGGYRELCLEHQVLIVPAFNVSPDALPEDGPIPESKQVDVFE